MEEREKSFGGDYLSIADLLLDLSALIH